MKRSAAIPLITVALVAAADLASKSWASATLPGHPPRTLGPLTLEVLHNPGVGFGLLTGSPAGAVALESGGLVVLGLLYAFVHTPAERHLLAVAGGGAIANFIDRLAHGTVTDWIHIAGYTPTFNLADIAVRIGVLTAVVLTIKGSSGRRTDREKQADRRYVSPLTESDTAPGAQ